MKKGSKNPIQWEYFTGGLVAGFFLGSLLTAVVARIVRPPPPPPRL